MIDFFLSHLGIAVSFLLTGYLGIRFLKLKGRYKSASYGLLILSLGFVVRSIFDFYKLFQASYWIIPEALLLIGVFLLTYSIALKSGNKKKVVNTKGLGKGKVDVNTLVKAGLVKENNVVSFFDKGGKK